MVKDIRIKTSLPSHIKTKKLIKKLGHQGFYCLISLWCYASNNKPKGILENMTEEDIAIASDWDKEAEIFVHALCECGFLQKNNDAVYSLHDWEKHNPWVYFSEQRSEIARKNVMKRYKKKQGKTANRKQTVNKSNTNSKQSLNDPYTPSPSPSPSPIKEKENTFVSHDKIVFDWKHGKFRNISDILIEKWKEAYPALDLQKEIKKAEAWVLSNPKNKKSNYERFLSNWMSKAQDKAPKVPNGNPAPQRKAEDEELSEEEIGNRRKWLDDFRKKNYGPDL